MNKFFSDFAITEIDPDPMSDLIALEDESQAVADFHNGFLCTVDE